MRQILPIAAAVVAVTLSGGSVFAASAIQKECSVKYQAAKAANTLNGMKYKDFYKQCSAEAKAGAAAAPAAPPAAAPTAASVPPKPKPVTPTVAPAAPAAPPPATTATRAPAAPAAVGAAVFPSAVSPQYQSLSAGKARFKTCDDQYRINKTNNGNGGLKWIEKGGGYYSECNKRLKS